MKANRTKKILDPQEYACSLISKWDWKDTEGLLRYMVSVWKQEQGEAEEISSGIFLFYDGGFSENEMLMSAFNENYLARANCECIFTNFTCELIALQNEEKKLDGIKDKMRDVFWKEIKKLKH